MLKFNLLKVHPVPEWVLKNRPSRCNPFLWSFYYHWGTPGCWSDRDIVRYYSWRAHKALYGVYTEDPGPKTPKRRKTDLEPVQTPSSPIVGVEGEDDICGCPICQEGGNCSESYLDGYSS